MLLRYIARMIRNVSPRLLYKAARLWVVGGLRAMRAHRQRLARDELFPPFLFLALTDACNLRCRGCWIESHGRPNQLTWEEIQTVVESGRKHAVNFFALLGGEPFLYPDFWRLIKSYPDCYFQIITNGLFLTPEVVSRLRRAGNVSPLVSIDGRREANDERRGEGVFDRAVAGLKEMKRGRLLFGVATTVTSRNIEEVLDESYVKFFIEQGAAYLWYYGYRPVGADPAPHLALDARGMREFRRRLIALRKRSPIILIDTYWDAEGKAVCPAAAGLGFHIGPQGSIEPCPPLSLACETVRESKGDLFSAINRSAMLRDFQEFCRSHTNGCVILEQPQRLAEFFTRHRAADFSGRDVIAELSVSEPRPSHDLGDDAMPEESRLYRFLKRQLFFGMGGYG